MNYKLHYESSSQKNRFDLVATVKNDKDAFDIRTYRIGQSLSWAELVRTLIYYFNDPSVPNALVENAIKNGKEKKNAS